jgi:hypothetical protein
MAYKFKHIALLLSLSACAPMGKNFCIANGYPEDSAQYKECVSRYAVNADLYSYCTKNRGIAGEGGQLNQCLESARQLKTNYSQDVNSCQRDADNKFAAVFRSPKRERQPTLHSNGLVTLDEIAVDEGYSSLEQQSYLSPFIQRCMSIYGWNQPISWAAGKTYPNMSSITSNLSALNREPIQVVISENPIARLFKAVSDGDIDSTRHIIINEGVPVNAQNYQGYSALHVAVKQGNRNIARMLVKELNANTQLRSAQGQRPIDLAPKVPAPDLFDILIDAGVHEIRKEIKKDKHSDEHRHDDSNRSDNNHKSNGSNNKPASIAIVKAPEAPKPAPAVATTPPVVATPAAPTEAPKASPAVATTAPTPPVAEAPKAEATPVASPTPEEEKKKEEEKKIEDGQAPAN